eukprot:CAMPEP_0175128816 /NCGR_PEP_ID=MMETSP0087-20121206/5136_1 /TAXON_ID=136419 /ORGANISM="Unknown Unknown, Strain D1" /LENGTH=71 /DNA_ID=CAMNT_0016410915 /DNA_START=18 /DNA_END=233 /DNA_ORIENTATION=-
MNHAGRGDIRAMTQLGIMHFYGWGVVDKNLAESRGWLLKSSMRGDPEAKFMLENLFDKEKRAKMGPNYFHS